MCDGCGNKEAPSDKIWVCLACGKTSRWKYGFDDKNSDYDGSGRRYASHGWDESCMMNCELFDKNKLVFDEKTRLVTKVLDEKDGV